MHRDPAPKLHRKPEKVATVKHVRREEPKHRHVASYNRIHCIPWKPCDIENHHRAGALTLMQTFETSWWERCGETEWKETAGGGRTKQTIFRCISTGEERVPQTFLSALFTRSTERSPSGRTIGRPLGLTACLSPAFVSVAEDRTPVITGTSTVGPAIARNLRTWSIVAG